jgi:Putative adhesin
LTKHLFAACVVAGLILSLAGATLAHDEKTKGQPGGEKIERSLTVHPEVTVTLCVASGTLKVRGWEKSEIHVRSIDAVQLDFRRIDKTKDTSQPATRVDVMVTEKRTPPNPRRDCQAHADVEMEVPSGATVGVQTDGDIMIAGVAGAYAGSQNGDIAIERVAKFVEAGSVGGGISLRDSSGRVNLSSAGGGIEVFNVRAANEEDTFDVGTVSGDIQLERVSTPKVNAKTVSGTLMMSGPLAKKGNYALTNITGDMVLAMPHDASFQLNAKVSGKHVIVSDFQLKYLTEPPPPQPAAPGKKAPEAKPKPPMVKDKLEKDKSTGPVVEPIVIAKPRVAVQYVLQRVTAICGSGDATISVASFGGTVRLKKI